MSRENGGYKSQLIQLIDKLTSHFDLSKIPDEDAQLKLTISATLGLRYIKTLSDELDKLNQIPYFNDELEPIYQHFFTLSQPKDPDMDDYFQAVLGITKPEFRVEKEQVIRDIKQLEATIRSAFADKLTELKAKSIPDDEELPTKEELQVLKKRLIMMITNFTWENTNNPLAKLITSDASIVKEINKMITLLQGYHEFNKAEGEEKKKHFYFSINLLRINPDCLIEAFVKTGSAALEKDKIKDKERDEAHAKTIIQRLAKIQYLVFQAFVRLLNPYKEQLTNELTTMKHNDIANEITTLRDQLKDYIPESDRVGLFQNQSEIPFYKRINETLILLKKLNRLKDPDLQTPGDKSAALEKYNELIEDRVILRKYREELEQIRSKIPRAHFQKGNLIVHRLVFVVQHVASEMRDYLKSIQASQAVENSLEGFGSSSLEYSAHSTAASLTFGSP